MTNPETLNEYKVVAVFNSDDDLSKVIRQLIEELGYHTFGGTVKQLKNGEINIEEFMTTVNPDILFWDITDPVDENIRYLHLFAKSKLANGKTWLVTTPYKDEIKEIETKSGLPVRSLNDLLDSQLPNTLKEELQRAKLDK